MKFQVDVPDEVFWKLAARAEEFDMRVPDYTAELVTAASKTKTPMETDPVVVLWRLGMCDADIARELNRSNASVAERRRGYNLPANRRYTKGRK